MPTTLIQQGLNLLFLAVLAFIAIGLGLLVLAKNRLAMTGWGELIFFSVGIGFALLGYSIFVLGVFQALQPIALSILLSFGFIFSLAGWFRSWHLLARPLFPLMPKLRIEKLAAILLILGLLASLMLCLTPDPGKDALIYHLAVPKLFLKHQGFYFISGNIFSNYPLFNEMLFLLALWLRGEVLAKGMHFIALLGILLGIWQFTRLRTNEQFFPFLSMLIFLSVPSVFMVSHLAYNDLFITYYSMAAVLAFIRWVEQRESPWLVLFGVFSGLAIASKYTALLLPLLGCLGVLWACWHHRANFGEISRRLFLYLFLVVLLGAPFYMKNWIMTGNPFYPFFYPIFGGRGWDPDQARLYDYFVSNLGMGRSFSDYLLLPWNVSFRAKLGSPAFDGLLGPIFFLTLPFLIGVRRIEFSIKIIIIYCAFTFLFWASSAQQIRYLIPIFPFLALFVGILLAYYNRRYLRGLLGLLILGSLIFNGFFIARYFLEINPLRVVVGLEDRDSFLSRRLPSYGMFKFINTHLPENSRIFLIYLKNWGFLLDRDYYSDSMFESYTIQKIIFQSASAKDIDKTLKASGFTHLLVDLNYIYGDLSTFSPPGKEKFFNYQTECLSLQKKEGPYYLFQLK
jgi:hypothetical protein